MGLICHTVGSVPFRSPVLSFCAMRSRKVYGGTKAGGRGATRTNRAGDDRPAAAATPAAEGVWEDPGNYNSNLSALIWTAQLVLFDYACFQKQNDENQIPDFLQVLCRKFFQQLVETPFGGDTSSSGKRRL